MSHNDAYRALLAEIALEIGVNAHTLVESQTIVVDGIPLSFSSVTSASGDAIECVCKVGALPQQPSIKLLRALLQANTLGPITMGSTLGLRFDVNEVIMAQRYPIGMPVQALARACRAQCEGSRMWMIALAEGPPPDFLADSTL